MPLPSKRINWTWKKMYASLFLLSSETYLCCLGGLCDFRSRSSYQLHQNNQSSNLSQSTKRAVHCYERWCKSSAKWWTHHAWYIFDSIITKAIFVWYRCRYDLGFRCHGCLPCANHPWQTSCPDVRSHSSDFSWCGSETNGDGRWQVPRSERSSYRNSMLIHLGHLEWKRILPLAIDKVRPPCWCLVVQPARNSWTRWSKVWHRRRRSVTYYRTSASKTSDNFCNWRNRNRTVRIEALANEDDE